MRATVAYETQHEQPTFLVPREHDGTPFKMLRRVSAGTRSSQEKCFVGEVGQPYHACFIGIATGGCHNSGKWTCNFLTFRASCLGGGFGYALGLQVDTPGAPGLGSSDTGLLSSSCAEFELSFSLSLAYRLSLSSLSNSSSCTSQSGCTVNRREDSSRTPLDCYR